MPGYGRCYWAEQTPRGRRRSRRAYRGQSEADVVVVGGGLSGAVAAYVFAAGGLDVVLLEADRLAGGATATGPGVIQPEPAESFTGIASAHGMRTARTAWAAARRSALDLASAIRKLPGRVPLTESSLLVNARTDAHAQSLRRDLAARKRVGVQTPWVAPSVAADELGTTSHGALRVRGVFQHDPVSTTLAFAKAAEARGARLHERSPVRRTRFDRHGAEVVLAGGTIRADGVFIATGSPAGLFGQLRRHFRDEDGFVVVTEPFTPAMRREAGRRTGVLVEPGDDRHWLRWLPGHRALFAGALSSPVPPRRRDKTVVQRTGQLMYELSLRYPVMSGLPARWGWRAPLVSSLDGLPWIGSHRNFPHHYFTFASGPMGDALAWFAARTALRHFTDRVRAGDDVFAHRA